MKLFIISTALIYILFVAFLFITQRSMIYFPDKSKPAPVQGAEIVKVIARDNQKLESWYFAPKDKTKPVIVFFHGNAGNYSHRLYKVQYYLDAGYGVLLTEYRGYGGNSGEISEQGFYSDGRAYIDWLMSEKDFKSERIVIYGESIGSGAAVQMAVEYDVGGLILEVPFSSLLEIASKQYPFVPVKYLLKDRFMNIEKIGNINTPLLILHGNKDKIIPFASADKLFKAAKQPKKFIDFPDGEHNNLYDFGASSHILDFLAGIAAQ